MAKLTQVVNMLSSWGYVSVVKIKTKSEPSLKITVKRADDFQKHFDSFAEKLQERREQREQENAEKKAKEVDGEISKAADAEEVETKAESDSTPAAETEVSQEASSQAAAAPVQLELPT